VAERYYDEGQTVAANQPLLLIVELDPILGVVYVTEKDYAYLRPGQTVSLTTDAYSGCSIFRANRAYRPHFSKSHATGPCGNDHRKSRAPAQTGHVHAGGVVLKKVLEATIVPEQALTTRDDRKGVFVVSRDGRSVAWRPVKVGIREKAGCRWKGKGCPAGW
jgi:hypothetical protein